MDFFQHQAKAKSRTFLLVILYCLGLLGLTAVLIAGTLLFCLFLGVEPNPEIILYCVGTILAVVITGSLCKTAQLSASGGRGVAESLGGRQVCASTTHFAERQLYNVVGEMALAAGIPTPALYILDRERSINAFAAGFSSNAAVLGVNRGTIDLLTRDELQGVIAHEFSHILNGDMRMNTRLIGILYGLQQISLHGYYAFRLARFFAGGVAFPLLFLALALALVGLVLTVIGYIGVLCSALIQAAISRQREYLADASAVQFTRNPDGVVGALKKIGAPNIGSNVLHPRAAEASHLFFGNTCGLFSLGSLLATHPDLTTRIRRIQPRFDGWFPPIVDTRPKPQVYVHKSKAANFLKHQPTTDSKQSVMEHIGELSLANVLTARALLDAIPQAVSISADNPLTAQAVFFALLLDPDEKFRDKQFNQIVFAGSDFLMKETRRLYPQIRLLSEHEKISLAQQVSATLREMTAPQYRTFSRVLELLISAHPGTNLFEYTIQAMLHRDLDIHFGVTKQLRVRHTTLESIRMPVVSVLSYLACAGQAGSLNSRAAFSAAMRELGLSGAMLLPVENTPFQFDKSLRKLAEASPALKKRIFAAFMTCIWHDGNITPKEAGLIRAIAAMLAIPIPMLA